MKHENTALKRVAIARINGQQIEFAEADRYHVEFVVPAGKTSYYSIKFDLTKAGLRWLLKNGKPFALQPRKPKANTRTAERKISIIDDIFQKHTGRKVLNNTQEALCSRKKNQAMN